MENVLLMILEPIYEVEFDQRSFGYRPERSAHSALRYIATKCISDRWVIEGDIYKCFDINNHQTLMNILKERIRDELILKLIKGFLKSKIHNDGKLWDPSVMRIQQGGILSPLLCNILLDKLDKKIRE